MKEEDPFQGEAGGSDNIRDITRLLKAMSADMIRLVLVEARLFGHTALAMIGLTVVIALLLVGSWLFIGAALVMALASLQPFSLTGALLTVALAHLVLAALAFWRLRYITRGLTFRESRASVNSLLVHARSLVEAAGQRTEDK
ncbi:hypothetical protein Tel_10765 [Candidatus Tenderia electrophaga]|jgi:hypothetical protein|uniref:Phage holin family protein n=1 Tax=Candidatus Tenderia electrophaga TaxID=1748243 RepID=A0A0S2TEK4_9GAMM|nr:hypothetical protein Tel_10765 [Candidatus Tenderia electrophaga]